MGPVLAALAMSWLCISLLDVSALAGGRGEMAWSSAQEIQRRYRGWFLWQCWDEAQRVAIEIKSARSDLEGKVVAEGIEHYEVGLGFRSVPARLILDTGTGRFQLWETDDARDGDALLTLRGPYAGVIVRSGQRVGLSAARDGESCEPKVLLEADAGDEVIVVAVD